MRISIFNEALTILAKEYNAITKKTRRGEAVYPYVFTEISEAEIVANRISGKVEKVIVEREDDEFMQIKEVGEE